MKALLTKPENDSPSRQNLPPPAPVPTRSIAPISDDVLSLQGKAACACGGGCPACRHDDPLQTLVEVSQPGDVLRYSSGASAQGVTEVPPVVRNVLRSLGEPLDPATRAFMEPRFGRDFSDVRVHTGDRASASARALNASAYTVGRDIVFRDSQFAPGTSAGRQLLAHELVHVAQQHGGQHVIAKTPDPLSVSDPQEPAEREAVSVATRLTGDLSPQTVPHVSSFPQAKVYRELDDQPAPPTGFTLGEDPDYPLVPLPAAQEKNEDADSEVGYTRDFVLDVSPTDPTVFIVPLAATGADIASRLFGDPDQTRAFDYVSGSVAESGGPSRGVRPRVTDRLVPDAATMLRAALDQALTQDLDATTATLQERMIDDADEWGLIRRAIAWSRRSELKDSGGVSYFDRYLNSLDAIDLTERGLFSDSRRTALEWLLIETAEKSHWLYRLIYQRSARKVVSPYTGEEFVPWRVEKEHKGGLGKNSVVGQYIKQEKQRVGFNPPPEIWSITVKKQIVEETSLSRAEIAVRSSSSLGPRVIIPATNGTVYGYELEYLPEASEEFQELWWDYPGTVYIREGEFQAEFPSAGEPERTQRVGLLTDALKQATVEMPAPLFGLDFEVLSTATVEQRLAIIDHVFKSMVAESEGAGTHGADLIARVILSTPDSEVPALERRISTTGTLFNLLTLEFTPGLVVIGKAFTLKSLAAMPLGVSALTEIETLRFGTDESGVFHYAWGLRDNVTSAIVDPSAWGPAQTPRIGAEAGLPGESAGPLPRSAIVFQVCSWGEGIFTKPQVDGNTRPFLPTELVRIELLGEKPETRIVTALEAAALMPVSPQQILLHGKKLVSALLWAQAAGGLARAFGPALAEGLLAGGVRAGIAALTKQASTEAGKQALRAFFMDALFLGSMEVVDAYRDELQQTAEGRAFLATYDIVMAVLITRDVYRLSAGVLRHTGELAAKAWLVASATARTVVRRASLELEALALALERLEKAGELVAQESATGARVLVPKNDATALNVFMAARAEVASRAFITTLREAGASTEAAERVFKQLQELASKSKDMARAQGALARRAEAMAPAAAADYLNAIERALQVRPGATEIAGFLRASTRAADPIAFLGDVEWLLARRGVGLEAVEALGNKAAEGTLDLAWLRTTQLTNRDLSFLGRNPQTPWNALRDAALDPTKEHVIWAQQSIRGASAEIAAQRTAKDLFPGFRITGHQVEVEGGVMDYRLTGTDGLGKKYGAEVKGWTRNTWSEALSGYRARLTGSATKVEEKAAKKIDGMLTQLKNARTATNNDPFLVVSDAMKEQDKRALEALLKAEVPGTQIKNLSEETILETGRQLRTALGLP